MEGDLTKMAHRDRRFSILIGAMAIALVSTEGLAQGIQLDREPAVGECVSATRGTEAIRVCNENGRFVIRPVDSSVGPSSGSSPQQRIQGQEGARGATVNQPERQADQPPRGNPNRTPMAVVSGDPTIPFAMAFAEATGRTWPDASDVIRWNGSISAPLPGEIASWNFTVRGKPRNIQVFRGCKTSDVREFEYYCEISFSYTPAHAPPQTRARDFSRVPPSAGNLLTPEDDERALVGGCSAVLATLSRQNAARLTREVTEKLGWFLRGVPFETRADGFTYLPRNVTGRDPPHGRDGYNLWMERQGEVLPDNFASVTYTSTVIRCYVAFYAKPRA